MTAKRSAATPTRIRLFMTSPRGGWVGAKVDEGHCRSTDQLDDADAARCAATAAAARRQRLREPAVDAGLRRGAEAGAAGYRVDPVAREAVAGEVEGREAADVVGAVVAVEAVRVVVDGQEHRRADERGQHAPADVRDGVPGVVVDPVLVVDLGGARP